MSAVRCVLLHVSVLIPVPEAAIEWKQNFRQETPMIIIYYQVKN